MSEYSPQLQDEFRTLRDGLEVEFIEQGLLFRDSDVRLVTVTTTGGDAAMGRPGTRSTTGVSLSPRPQVNARAQYRSINGAPVLIGDCGIVVSRAYSEEDLTSASYFEVDGVKHTLVDGELRKAPNGLDWALILKRA